MARGFENVGINFETDALTATRNSTTVAQMPGRRPWLAVFFDLDEQLVFELAMLRRSRCGIGAGTRNTASVSAIDSHRPGLALRADVPIHSGGKEENSGIRAELRRKF